MKKLFYLFMLLFLWLGTGANSLQAQNALNFDGVNDNVTFSSPQTELTSNFTIETWFNWSGNGTDYPTLLVIGDGSNDGYGLQINKSTGKVGWFIAGMIGDEPTSISTNTWTHVALVRDNDNIYFYVNGALIDGSTSALEPFTPSEASFGGGFAGSLDETRIWNRVLSQVEIQNTMSCGLGSGQTDLAAYYKYNQSSGTSLTDDSGNGNTGTLTNFALTGATSNWVTSGISTTVTPSVSIAASTSGTISSTTSVTFTATPTNGGGSPTYQWKKNGTDVGTNSTTYTNATWANNDIVTCVLTSTVACVTSTTATSTSITMTVGAAPPNALNFDGVNDLVDCGNAANLQLSTGTIEAWIKTSGAGAGFRAIVVKQYAYGLFLNSNVLVAYDWTTSSVKSTGVNLADGQWHHVAFVFQPTANLSKIYIDGVPRLTIASAWGIAYQTVPLKIGDGDVAVPYSQCFNGSIDGVRVWNTARTDAQIASDYSCQLTGSESGLVACYNFNQGVAAGTNTGLTTLADATVHANNGTLTNFALTGATSNWVTNDYSTVLVPSVSIAASPSGAITTGTSVTFTATPTQSGSTPTYVWEKGGVAISGQTAATYTSNTLANGDVITCVVTSNLPCASPTTATSTGITMTVTGPFTYTWTGATSTDWATATNWNPNGIPTSTDNIIIPTTANKPMLPANQTIANMNLTGTNKVILGNNTLCVNAITGGSSSSYVVTNGTGSLIIKALPTNAATTFPIGASETSYDPLSIHPTNSVDFTAKVKATAVAGDFSGSITNFAKTAKRQWDITPSATAGSTVLTLTNGGTAYTVVGTPKVGHYSGTAWTELAATHNNSTWTATTSSFSPFGVGEAGGFVTVLPVELLTFTGYNKGGVNILNWQTANEVNNKGFQVERLMDNGQWTILGFVNAKGKAATYDFTDNTPLSTSYYRLRQIDNDGKETLSKVISIVTKGNAKLNVYPNPVSNTLTIETDFDMARKEANRDYQIINLLGQTVLRGTASTQINVSALPQGSYVLKVGAEQVKFVKQ